MSRLAIRDARIVDGRGGDPIEGGAIVVEGSRLAYVGPAARAPIDGDGTLLDAGGRTVVPGLINCHTHITIDEMDLVSPRRHYLEGELVGILDAAARARRALENGITSIRDCNAPGLGTFALRTVFDRNTLPGPRLFLSARAVTATGGHMHAIGVEADGSEGVRRAVREQLKAGADFIKLVAEAPSGASSFDRPSLQLTAEEMAAGVDVAHRLNKRVTAHAVTQAGIGEALAAGVDCIEHGYGLSDEQIELMRQRGTWLVPTLSVHGAYLRRGREAGVGPERLAHSERVLASGLSAVARAFKAGVNLACGSDAGSPLNPVWELAPELELLCRAGLTPGQAIVAATRRAAELIGVEQRLGTLEAGKLADLVVVDGDPLADVSALGQVVAVVKDGRLHVNRLPGSAHRPVSPPVSPTEGRV